eukprot:363041-Chlamydomonas_euryale.AAC.3
MKSRKSTKQGISERTHDMLVTRATRPSIHTFVPTCRSAVVALTSPRASVNRGSVPSAMPAPGNAGSPSVRQYGASTSHSTPYSSSASASASAAMAAAAGAGACICMVAPCADTVPSTRCERSPTAHATTAPPGWQRVRSRTSTQPRPSPLPTRANASSGVRLPAVAAWPPPSPPPMLSLSRQPSMPAPPPSIWPPMHGGGAAQYASTLVGTYGALPPSSPLPRVAPSWSAQSRLAGWTRNDAAAPLLAGTATLATLSGSLLGPLPPPPFPPPLLPPPLPPLLLLLLLLPMLLLRRPPEGWLLT